jgi:hypothetical protein
LFGSAIKIVEYAEKYPCIQAVGWDSDVGIIHLANCTWNFLAIHRNGLLEISFFFNLLLVLSNLNDALEMLFSFVSGNIPIL